MKPIITISQNQKTYNIANSRKEEIELFLKNFHDFHKLPKILKRQIIKKLPSGKTYRSHILKIKRYIKKHLDIILELKLSNFNMVTYDICTLIFSFSEPNQYDIQYRYEYQNNKKLKDTTVVYFKDKILTFPAFTSYDKIKKYFIFE